jgi:DNA-binding LacI/PurR family transcriptional regulator
MTTPKARVRKPKYLALAKRLAREIETGVLQPGDRLPSFGEMAQQFGIASNTADRVFAKLEQDGLVRREVGRGIFVCEPPRRSQTGLLGLTGIGLARRDFHPLPSHLAEGIESVASEAGFQLLPLKNHSPLGWDKVDGVFLCEPDALASLQQLPPGLPCVSLLMPLAGVASVVADDLQGGLDAANHLIGLGHRRIAFLVTNFHPLCQRRMSGYHVALRAAGICPEPRWVSEPAAQEEYAHNRTRGRHIMQRWLENGWRESGCTALLAQNDEVAIGAMQVLQAAGMEVPQAVSVVGFDGTEISEQSTPTLTTVRVPFAEIGAAGAEVLIQQINGASPQHSSLALPISLKIGASTAPPAPKAKRAPRQKRKTLASSF